MFGGMRDDQRDPENVQRGQVSTQPGGWWEEGHSWLVPSSKMLELRTFTRCKLPLSLVHPFSSSVCGARTFAHKMSELTGWGKVIHLPSRQSARQRIPSGGSRQLLEDTGRALHPKSSGSKDFGNIFELDARAQVPRLNRIMGDIGNQGEPSYPTPIGTRTPQRHPVWNFFWFMVLLSLILSIFG